MEATADLPLAPDALDTAEAMPGTLEFLLRRMRHKTDFPALSSTLTAINDATASEDSNAQALIRSILKDFALTTKLLKVVNTAYYGSFGGAISTISRAVAVLGYDRIRNAAITLMLFEHLQDRAEATQLRDDLVATYFSGILARQLVSRAGLRDAEEAFICATFHALGRLLTRFYLPEEAREIQRLMNTGACADEMLASGEVLGLNFSDLGMGVAQAWHFPGRVVQSMRCLPGTVCSRPKTEEEKLRLVSAFSSAVCDAMRDPDEAQREAALGDLIGKFGSALGVNAQVLAALIKASAGELAQDAVVLKLKTEGSAFVASASSAGRGAAAAEVASEVQSVINQSSVDGALEAPSNPQRKAMLSAGIQDITTVLAGDHKLNEILRRILETMYRGAGFTRVLLFVRENPSGVLRSRFGLGNKVDAIIERKFGIVLTDQKNVFQAALHRAADIYIDDVQLESIRKYLPESYLKTIPAKSFALFPIIVRGKPVGLFYGDSDEQGAIRFSTEELSLLKTLRNQAVLALKQG